MYWIGWEHSHKSAQISVGMFKYGELGADTPIEGVYFSLDAVGYSCGRIPYLLPMDSMG